MTLLITGGTGFIGSRLALHARSRGAAVKVTGAINTSQEEARARKLAAAGVQVIIGQLQNSLFAANLVHGVQQIVHLAAAQHESHVPDSYFHDVNVGGTQTLLEASVHAGVQRFVYGSTIGVYGSAVTGCLDESTPARPDNIYGRTKLEAEGVVRSFETHLATTIVRISETYGPGDFRLLKLFKGVERGTFRVIGAGSNQRQLIHVDDLVQGLLLASTHVHAPGQTFVLAGPEIMTTNEMVAHVAHALNTRSPRFNVPMWPFMAAAIMFEKTFKPLGISPPLHRRRLDFFRKSFYFSTDKAQALLGFRAAIPFSRGARETAEWYVKEGLLRGHRSAVRGPRPELGSEAGSPHSRRNVR
jgi:nucleoside-diphosphate-sugar epimerase